MLAIGRALMSKPRLLLIDEASLGLSPSLAKTVFQVVERINDDGVTVIIVEQNVGVLPYADRALIMEKGTLIYSGVGDEIRHANLRETYLPPPRGGGHRLHLAEGDVAREVLQPAVRCHDDPLGRHVRQRPADARGHGLGRLDLVR